MFLNNNYCYIPSGGTRGKSLTIYGLWRTFFMFCIRVFFVFSFSAFQRIQTKKDSRLSQDSYLYINLISIMKNNSYSVHARLHDCSLSKRAMSIFIALIYRDLCFRMERFHQHLEPFVNEKNNPIFCRFADFA